jgi:hypothetical protein
LNAKRGGGFRLFCGDGRLLLGTLIPAFDILFWLGIQRVLPKTTSFISFSL